MNRRLLTYRLPPGAATRFKGSFWSSTITRRGVALGRIREPKQVLPIIAVISRHESAVGWVAARLAQAGKSICLCSHGFAFGETGFYEREMGAGLFKAFFAVEQLMDETDLADWKVQTNRLEEQFRDENSFPEPRPLNLDPGYLSDAKLVLATTKDRDHRIAIGQGIYAEVTLHYEGRQWVPARWTYPDYRREDYHSFLSECREWFRRHKVRE